jgi:hypothetical protein
MGYADRDIYLKLCNGVFFFSIKSATWKIQCYLLVLPLYVYMGDRKRKQIHSRTNKRLDYTIVILIVLI